MQLDVAGISLWAVFLLSWTVARAWTARALKQNSPLSIGLDGIGYLLGFALLLMPQMRTPAMWRTPFPIGLALLALQAASFVFAWWARLTLGRLWSGMITLREGHRVVQSGPYGLVRHPIYTGLIGAAWSFALIVASPTTLIGAFVLTATMAFKAKREEAFLRGELGDAEYDDYARRTPMLVPRIKAPSAPGFL